MFIKMAKPPFHLKISYKWSFLVDLSFINFFPCFSKDKKGDHSLASNKAKAIKFQKQHSMNTVFCLCTLFENHWKSLILQHCERSELRLFSKFDSTFLGWKFKWDISRFLNTVPTVSFRNPSKQFRIPFSWMRWVPSFGVTMGYLHTYLHK